MKQAVFKYLPKLEYAAKEAVNKLCTNITFTGADTTVLQLTSYREHEGKTLLTLCVWSTLAEMGFKTALVDADLRRSIINGKCGISYKDEAWGLGHYLAKRDVNAGDIVYETNIPNAHFIPAGCEVANSMQLLTGHRFETLMNSLKKEYDYVIIDTPPIGAIVDAATIARCCDGALLVVTQNKTTREELLNAKEQIEKAGCPLLGTVLNRVKMDSISNRYYSSAYYSVYRSGYYSHDKKRKK